MMEHLEEEREERTKIKVSMLELETMDPNTEHFKIVITVKNCEHGMTGL